MLALDVLNGNLAIKGWQESASSVQEELLRPLQQAPLAAIIHTDIARDGGLTGMNTQMLETAAAAAPCPLIASGGFSSSADAKKLIKIENLSGVIVGRAVYQNPKLLKELISAYQGR